MGKSKELFMQIHYPNTDIEREYLVNDALAQAWEEEEYENLKQELNQTTKIEVTDGRETRIEINQKEHKNSQ